MTTESFKKSEWKLHTEVDDQHPDVRLLLGILRQRDAEIERLRKLRIRINQAFIWARDARPARFQLAITNIEKILEKVLEDFDHDRL